MSKIFFKKTFLILIIIFTTSSNADDKMALGIEVYNNKAQCGVCHTLKSAGSNGQIGPNLDVVKPTIEQIESKLGKLSAGARAQMDGDDTRLGGAVNPRSPRIRKRSRKTE